MLPQVLTLSGWSDVMHHAQDALSPAASIFFLGLIAVGPIQLTSYFVALVGQILGLIPLPEYHLEGI